MKIIAQFFLVLFFSLKTFGIENEQICKEYVSLARSINLNPKTEVFLFCENLVGVKTTEKELINYLRTFLSGSNTLNIIFAPYQGGGNKIIKTNVVRSETLKCNLISDVSSANCSAYISGGCTVGVERIEVKFNLKNGNFEMSETLGFKPDGCISY